MTGSPTEHTPERPGPGDPAAAVIRGHVRSVIGRRLPAGGPNTLGIVRWITRQRHPLGIISAPRRGAASPHRPSTLEASHGPDHRDRPRRPPGQHSLP